ncbi:MAG: choice-of-anchor D domain-containing protein [Deltaproteobacteria bacterium]|nr:choice-of-anchor D domain-containing protein [Deltaproteobacteria bacterium]
MKLKGKKWAKLAVLLVVVFIIYCSDSTSTTSTDEGVMSDISIQKCSNSAQCKSGFECDPVKRICVPSRPDGGEVCKNNLDCPESDMECVGGRCIRISDIIAFDVYEDVELMDVSFYCDDDEDCKDESRVCDLNTHKCVDKNRPVLFVDPQVINFGAVFFGQCAKRTFKIQNIGTANLRVSMLDFESGTNPEPPLPQRFTLSIPINVPGDISAGSSIDVEVQYCQDDAVPDKGNILIISNDESKPQYKLPIVSAYKDSPDFAIIEESDFNKKLWPPTTNPYQYTVDMGNAELGREIRKRIYFTNMAGEAILEISKLYLTKTTASNNIFDMRIYNNIDEKTPVSPPIYDNPAEVYFVEVVFKCNEDKFDEASVITFNTNDKDIDNDLTPDDGITSVMVRAQCNYRGPKLMLDKQRVDFGTVQVNDEKSEQIVAKNDGKVNLVITEALIENPGNSLTLLVNNSSVQLPLNVTPGGSVTFTIKYAPKTIETLSTKMIIKSNDSLGNDNVSIPITASAIDPTISVDNTSIDFGIVLHDPIKQCSSETKTITISNAGFGKLVISSIGLTIGSSSDFALSNVPNTPIVLDSAQKISINVSFTPSVGSQQNGLPTQRTGAISIKNSDRKSNYEVVIPLYGAGKTCCPPRENAMGDCTCGSGCIYACLTDYYDLNSDLNNPNNSNGCEYYCVISSPPREVCDGKDNDCNGFTDEGNINTLCPPPLNATTECTQGNCRIKECLNGYYDVDQIYSTGCECQADSNDLQGVGNSCAGALTIQGEFIDSARTSLDVTGKIVPFADEDWYRVVARDDVNSDRNNGGDNFNFVVNFVNNPNNAYMLEIRESDCSNANVKCINDTIFQWRTNFNADVISGGNFEGENPCTSSCFSNNFTTNCCNDNSRVYFIKIYRNPIAPYKCDSYTIRISNGL